MRWGVGNGELMRWNLAAAVLAIAVAVAAVMATTATVGALLLIGLLALYVRYPKAGAGVSVVGILLGSGLATSTGIGVLGYLDETLILLPLVVFVSHRVFQGKGLRKLPGWGWLSLYIIFGIISSLTHHVPLALAGQSAFLILKGFIFAFAVAQLDWTADDVRRMVKPAAWILAIVLVMSVVNLAIPEAWAKVFSRRLTGVDYRLGLPSLIGPFDHEFAYGQFMALSAVAVLAFRANVRKSTMSAWLLAGSFVGLILSFRRKAIAASIAALFTARIVSPGKRGGAIMTAVIALPLVAVVAWEGIASIVDVTYAEYFGDTTTAARTLLYRDGFALAAHSFPFGVGFARFGSYMASQVYSPEYVGLGYPSIYGLAPGVRGPYLSDTFWPSIVGEAGYLGLFAFAMAVFVMARQGSKLIKATDNPYARWIGVVLVGWTVEFAIESIAAPVFNSPPIFTLLFLAAGVTASLVSQLPETAAETPTHRTRALTKR
jgi:hypothetical protein